MKTNTICLIVILVVSYVCQSQTLPTQAAIAAKRQAAIVYNSQNAWPNPTTGNCAGQAAYCLSSYTLNQNTAIADQYILNLPIDAFRDGNDCYFWNLSFVRIYADAILFQRLSPAAQISLQDKMINCLNYHSKMSYLNAGVWQIVGSENHNLVRKSIAYLISQKLMENPANQAMVLDDGFTLATHYNTYRTFFKTYFKEHARQGLNVEINSNTYVKYTLACYLNIYDLTTDSFVKRQAKNFLDLYTAENAVTYLKNAKDVGGSATRQYKGTGIQSGKGKTSYNAALGWSSSAISNHPADVLVAFSSYNSPPLVNTIAFADKPNFLTKFLSWGIKLTPLFTGVYNIGFNAQDKGDVVRFSYFTTSYAHGTSCYNPTQVYTAIAEQNRAMGVTFNEPTATRITVHGVGTAQGRETGYNEINGMSGTNCSVIWRNKDSRNNIGTRIYVSNGSLINNKVVQNGWTFSETASAYVGYKVVQGTLSESSVALGKMYTLSDMNSPIIIETAKKTDFANFAAFKNAISNNVIQTLADGTIKYFSESNETYEVKPNSYVIPKINNLAINFNLPNTFNSPYLNGMGNSYVATVSYPGYDDYKIDFNDIQFELEAECATNSNWTSITSPNASSNTYLVANTAITNPFAEENLLHFNFEVTTPGKYNIFARGLFPNGATNSFFVSIDGGAFFTWGMATNANFIWNPLPDNTLGSNPYLSLGYHRITIAKRENGAGLDKLLISENAAMPTTVGFQDTTCTNYIDVHFPVCTAAPNLNASNSSGSVGITSHETKRTDWPNDVSGAHLVLESKNAGFVITRLTTLQRDTITNATAPNGAVEGMFIYNSTENKFQVFDGVVWKNIKLGCNN
jgi:hypothetical protein